MVSLATITNLAQLIETNETPWWEVVFDRAGIALTPLQASILTAYQLNSIVNSLPEVSHEKKSQVVTYIAEEMGQPIPDTTGWTDADFLGYYQQLNGLHRPYVELTQDDTTGFLTMLAISVLDAAQRALLSNDLTNVLVA